MPNYQLLLQIICCGLRIHTCIPWAKADQWIICCYLKRNWHKKALRYKINRGGDITYHGPGQVVGYPIFDLENFFTDIHQYLRYLEEAIILTLQEYGLEATRSEGETGVWLGVGTPFARKICAMGVRASRWVTMHGFALNVNVNLGYFDHIIPCGIKGKAVTSLQVELGVNQVDETELKQKIAKHFKSLFGCEFPN